ncbi:calcium-binding protein [uncultured Tateyamaria sp.]|uniref:calcium-binding protein n=1 Tax=uncultured Tateyamaria sp. TaxID=455651 RepID=UPI00262F15AC|nr:calcium-binding protein [uncultured Tateyamaria sp.]
MPPRPVVTISEGLSTDQGIIGNLLESMMLETTLLSSVTGGTPNPITTAILQVDTPLPSGQTPAFTVRGIGLTYSTDGSLPVLAGGIITDITWTLQSSYAVTFSQLNFDVSTLLQAAIDELGGLTDAMEDFAYRLPWEYNGNSAADLILDTATTADGVSADLSGDNRINTFFGRDQVFAGDGDDIVNSGRQNDTIDGGAGNDRLRGNDGFDLIYGGAGDDHIEGNYGYDTLIGGTGNDTILGKTGDDVIRAGVGDDLAQGGSGRDHMRGEAGNDTLIGFDGRDTIFGGQDDDFLDGRLHDDVLVGEAGNDTIIGGKGSDIVVGGQGADVFVFYFTDNDQLDHLLDYDRSVDQIVLLDGTDFILDGNYIRYGDGNSIQVNGPRAEDLTIDDVVVMSREDFFGLA